MTSEKEIDEAKKQLRLIILKRKLKAYSTTGQIEKGLNKTGKVLKKILKL